MLSIRFFFRFRPVIFILAIIFCMLLSNSSHSEIYKWVGDDGSVFYSDTPPPREKNISAKTMHEIENPEHFILPDELHKLTYGGTAESLEKIKKCTYPSAQEGNIIAIDICRQTLIATSDERGLREITRDKRKHFGPKVIEQWVASVQSLATGGDAFYKTVLATIYLEGDWGSPDRKKAFALYKEAADAGYHDAMCKLGILYHTGTIVGKDTGRAITYYQKAGSMGSSIAYYNIGALYYNQTIPPSKTGHFSSLKNLNVPFFLR